MESRFTISTKLLSALASCAFSLAVLSLADPSGAGAGPDTDADGFQDDIDNCVAEANPSQNDSDQDGYGNLCDQDADQNGLGGGSDFGLWRQSLGQSVGDPGYNPDVEWDEPPNSTVGGTDFGMWKLNLGGVPGPSGRSCANPFIDVDDTYEGGAVGGALGTADANSIGCPDTRRRGTFSSS